MRIRSLFWFLLGGACAGVLLLAVLLSPSAQALMRISLTPSPASARLTTLTVRVTDTQGLPIEGARLLVRAWMTNMDMAAQTSVRPGEQPGTYLVSLLLPMGGPWAFTVSMQADGFVTLQQTLFVTVEASRLHNH